MSEEALKRAVVEIERFRAELAAMKSLAYDRLLQVEAVEAERDALRAALERIADADPDDGTAYVHAVANAALKEGKLSVGKSVGCHRCSDRCPCADRGYARNSRGL